MAIDNASLFQAINKANGIDSSGQSVQNKTSNTAQQMQDQFLTLLMAQLQNQDPLNPLENSELTSQLSQINMVSGIQSVNTSLQTLLKSFNDSQSLQAAALIGKNVLVPGNSLPLAVDEQGKVSGAIAGVVLENPADKVTITIKNASGEVVSVNELGAQKAGIVNFSWDGKDSKGNVMAAGNYTYSVEATVNNEKIIAQPMHYGTVYALSRDNGGSFVLDLGSSKVSLQDVQQII